MKQRHASTVSAIAAAVSLALGSAAFADAPRHIEVAAGDLAAALEAVSKQADVELIFRREQLKGLRTNGVSGTLSAREAVQALLQGTPLTLKVNDKTGAMMIGLSPTADAGAPNSSIRLAQADGGSESSTVGSGASGGATESVALEEILVTAQKRVERLQDVPVPVAAITADSLVNSNQLRLQDYYSSIPALNATVNEFGAPQLTIRGLTTGGFTAPTVAVVIDDVPYGPSTIAGYGEQAADFDPSDLARVEVLRGPQGTLYGASSLGGLVKFVTVDPSTEAFSGRVQAGVSGVKNGNEAGYSVRGAVNVPLSDTFALRASAFSRLDPGYIDDPVLGLEGVNEGRAEGGRLSGLWKPSDTVSLKISALVQRARTDGVSSVIIQPGLGDLEQSNAFGSGRSDKKLQVYSAVLNARLGRVDLTSLTGYNVNDLHQAFDYTPALGFFTQNGTALVGRPDFTGFGVSGTPLFDRLRTQRFTQEVRLTAPLGERIEGLLGGFYNHEETSGAEDLMATDFNTGAVAGQWARFLIPTTRSQIAAFGNLTVHVTDRFDVQAGARRDEGRGHDVQVVTGPYADIFLGSDPSAFDIHSKVNFSTWLLTPRFKVTPELMIYGRMASGYRPGGTNNIGAAANLPRTFDSDQTRNYEVGVKGTAFDRALSFDASVFYIDWRDIQLRLFDPVSRATYSANGGKAKSQGLELAVESRPLRGLTVGAWVTLNDAELTQDFPPTSELYGRSGNRLPYGSRVSGNLSFEQQFALTGSVTGFLGATLSYVGDRRGVFRRPTDLEPAPVQQEFPSYTRGDVRAGAILESWTVNLFANNVTDERGLIGGGLGTNNPAAFTYVQPRTIGLSLTKTFGQP